MLEYIDLLIQIGERLEENQYRLTVVSEPGGEADGVFALRVSEREVGSALNTLSLGARLTLAHLEGGLAQLVRGPSREKQQLVAFGRKLFDGLMQDESVRSCYDQTVQAMLADRDRGIRLRLMVEEPSLQAIPWELMYDGDRFLAVSGLTPMVRYVDRGMPADSMTAEPPLRLLVAIASPEDQRPLNVEKEQQVIERALQKSHGLVETTFLRHTSFSGLYQELLRTSNQGEPYHILHFIGHGQYREGEGELVFEEEETRKSNYINGEELGNVLHRHRDLRLVVLNACEGAKGSTEDPFNSVALSLLRAGVPAVVAMQFPISDRVATRFSNEFYYSLALGSPVDVALGDARTQMYAIEGSVEFATPILYMQVPDGQLFDVTDLPKPALQSVEQRVAQKRSDKEKGDLGGKVLFQPTWRVIRALVGCLSLLSWEMIGALAGVASLAITILAFLATGGSKPTPTPPHTLALSPTQAVTVPLTFTPTSRSWPVPPTITSEPTDTPLSPATGVTPPSTAPPPTGTPTVTPTVKPTETPTDTPTTTATPTGTPTSTPTPTDTPSPTPCPPHASFVEDVTVPDGTSFQPGTAFTKTWRVLSDGCLPWPAGTNWAFVSGDQMGAPPSVPVPDTPLGGTADISVGMSAPESPGTYKGIWQMQRPDGTRFGDQAYLIIVVPTPQPTATATATTPPSGSNKPSDRIPPPP